MPPDKLRIAILGSGPTGLEAALAAAERGFPFTLYETEPEAAGAVRRWGHVRLFTPWELNASERMRHALGDAGHEVPSNGACPTGRELVESLLQPLAELPQVAAGLRLGCRVRAVGRRGLLKHEEIGTPERGRRPFRLLVDDGDGEHVEEADVVLDCTGASVPNALGDGGIPAPGERRLAGSIGHDAPDLEHEADEWRRRKVLLVGAGHSAQTAARDFAARLAGETEVVWALRSENPSWGAGGDDPLPERAALGRDARRLATSPPAGFEVRRGVVVEALVPRDGRIEAALRRRDGRTEAVTVDRVLALTGRVGDHLLYRQLQVHECYATAGPMKLAAALLGAAGAGGDCLDQTSQGVETLVNPEPGFFLLGSKSYGRRNDYLMRVGWQQIDEVFGLLAQ